MFDRSSFAKKHTFLTACGSHVSGRVPIPINLKMNHVANQLIFEIISVHKFSIVGLKFKDFSNILLNGALPIFCGRTRAILG